MSDTQQNTTTWTPEWLARTSPSAVLAMSEHRERIAQDVSPAPATAHEEIR